MNQEEIGKFMPKVIFKKLSIEDNIKTLTWSAKPENSQNSPLNLYELTINLFPELKGKIKENLTYQEIYEIIYKEVGSILRKKHDESEDDKRYEFIWNKVHNGIIKDLEKKLDIKWPNDDITCEIGLVPVCPRYISEKSFVVNYGCSNDELIAIAIHELCHFIYFEKWKQLYPNYTEEEFDSPHIAWYLSEAMIDPLINNDTFRKYTNSNLSAYSNFYEINIDGESIINILREYVNNYSIDEAIKKGYELFLKHENLIKGLQDDIKRK